MGCPTCGQASFPSTHDISSAGSHIAVAELLEQLGEAIQAGWPKKIELYSKVAILMLSWKDGDITNSSDEFRRLKSVFQDEYQYEVDDWQIPSRMATPKLGSKASTFVEENFGKENLLIVYYAGHARRGVPAGSAPVWRSK
jgi:hypothetical protein